MMKVVYITSPSFFDADLSYINELKTLVDLTILIDLPSFALQSTALEITSQPSKAGIYPISVIKGFEKYIEFLGQKCFAINRPLAKRWSLETAMINRKLRTFLLELNPNLIHFNNPITQYGYSILKLPVEKVMTIHDPIPHIGEHPKNLAIRNWNMKYVKHYILLNEFQREAFISTYGLNGKQVHTTFLSAFNFYNSFKTELPSTKSLNLLFFGRITPYKGLEVLSKVFEDLKEKYPELKLTVAGKGQLPVSFENLDGITLINRFVTAEELSGLINQCDLIVCPYKEGTQSGVIMTSFAFSKPVLATKVGGFHEMVEDGITGFLVEPGSEESLRSKLIEILENPTVLESLSKNIDTVYHQDGIRSWKASAARTVSIYELILKKREC